MLPDAAGSRTQATTTPAATPPQSPATPPPATPSPPIENRAAQDHAVEVIEQKLDDSGMFNDVSRDEIRDAAQALQELSGVDAARVIERLQADGKLEKFARESVESQDRWGVFGGPGGFSHDEQRDFFNAMAGRLDGDSLATLSAAYKEAGDSHIQGLAEAIAAHATPQARVDYVQAMAGRTTDGIKPGVMESDFIDTDARAVATVLGSLRGDYAQQAFAALNAEQRAAVFTSAADFHTAIIVDYSSGMASPPIAWVQSDGINGLMAAAGSISDPQARAGVLSDAIDTLAGMSRTQGVTGEDTGPMARAILGAIDADTLARLSPDRVAALAEVAGKAEPDSLRAMAHQLAAQPASANRDALIRTLFLKTSGDAYEDRPELAAAMGQALARTETSDPARVLSLGGEYAALLNSESGRALLSDQGVNPTARLWAAHEAAASPGRIQGLVDGADKPWESAPLLNAFAQGRVDQFATARGASQVQLTGGTDIDNFIGAALGAPVRQDLPQDQAGLQRAQDQAAQGSYNFYQGVEAVQKPADGIRAAQSQMGGGPVSIGVLPVQFSSQETGPIDLQLYRLQGADGQTRFVDNTGRVYSDFNAWRTENQLPPGQMTYVADGELGGTRLETANTPNVSDTFWEHVRDVADVAALVGGVVASGVIIFASGGTATPLVAGAWTVAIGSAAYTGARAAGVLQDRADHSQTLSLTDPDARAAWLSLGASGLTVAGAGSARLAGLAAEGGDLAVLGARASGVLNASANYADAAATLDTAHSLVTNWDRLTPSERAQMGLSIAFWGGLTGASARATGGRVTDAFSFRQQINNAMIETGAAVRPSDAMAPGEVSVTPTRDPRTGAITNIAIEYGPGTSRAVIDVHRDVARALVANAGVEGAMRRAFGDPNAYPPGSRGEEVVLEVAKHQALVEAFQARLADQTLPAGDREAFQQALEDTRFELLSHQLELDRIRENPALGREPGLGHVDVKQSAQHWLDPDNTVPRDASARASFNALQTDVAQRFPDAQRIGLAPDGTFTLDDGTIVRNFGDGTNTLSRFVTPQAEGGYGGAIFYDRASNSLIVAVNMRSAGNENLVSRVEIPYTRNAAGEWRADFSGISPYTTNIDPDLAPDRGLHFAEANKNLRTDWAADPSIRDALGLSALDAGKVERGARASPAPYTWHHVDGGGEIMLVDSAIHGLFLHYGGFSEWTGTGAPR